MDGFAACVLLLLLQLFHAVCAIRAEVRMTYRYSTAEAGREFKNSAVRIRRYRLLMRLNKPDVQFLQDSRLAAAADVMRCVAVRRRGHPCGVATWQLTLTPF
jgi:hypothetical protein